MSITGTNLAAKDQANLIENLATMLGAGIPILEAVETLLPDSKGGTLKFLQLCQAALSEGKPLSSAMSQMPKAFDPVTVNLIRAGEEAGTLEEVLRDLEKSIKNDMEFRDKLRASMVYPSFILVIFVAVLTMILLFVVPRVSKVFLSLKVPLPTPTKVMIASSHFLTAHYMAMIAGVVVGGALIGFLYHSQKRAVLSFLLDMPGLTKLGRQIDLSRLTRSLALLLRAGIPLIEALKLSRAVVTKREMVKLVDQLEAAVAEGKPLSSGLRASKGLVPTITLHVIETAERSGALEKSMQEVAEYFQTQVSRRLATIATLIEPIMIVVIGLLVGGMMLSIIAPIYGLIGQIHSR